MELWFTERQTEAMALSCLVSRTIHREQSRLQEIAVLETVQYGRMLVLDNMIMVTEADEFIYHEMISHVPLLVHPNPVEVLVVGGGDGGTIREVFKHPEVKKVVLAEIDERVIDASRRFFPTLNTGFSDPRLEIAIGDGWDHVQTHPASYDVIIVDSSAPAGPSDKLFEAEFFRMTAESLRPGGIMVAQTESPFVNRSLLKRVFKDIKKAFSFYHPYLSFLPTYPSGMWSYTIAANTDIPYLCPRSLPGLTTKYYTPEIHRAAFTLPPFVAELLED